MTGHDIIVMGASAGGVEALTAITSELPADLPAAVVVVMHMPASGPSVLPTILGRACPLPVVAVEDGHPVERGTVYVAPPGAHLLVKRGHFRLVAGPKENGTRPAIDPLFRSAAAAYDSRAIGVILSGALDDGTEGLLRIHDRGGITVVLDPADALFPGMAVSAIENVPIHHVVGLADMGDTLARLAREPLPAAAEGTDAMEDELDLVEIDSPIASEDLPGKPSGFTCPECSGALWEVHDSHLIRYRCRVGHAYSPETLLSEQSESLEAALWAGARALEERASLQAKLAGRARERGSDLSAARFEGLARDARERAKLLRTVMTERVLGPAGAGLPVDPETGAPSEEAERREEADIGS